MLPLTLAKDSSEVIQVLLAKTDYLYILFFIFYYILYIIFNGFCVGPTWMY